MLKHIKSLLREGYTANQLEPQIAAAKECFDWYLKPEGAERWMGWLQRLMQMRLLLYFVDLIPRGERPKLPTRIFTKIFMYFFKCREFNGFLAFYHGGIAKNLIN